MSELNLKYIKIWDKVIGINTELWKKTVFDLSSIIDPNDEEDWRSLAIGWAMGRGMNIREAKVFYQHLLSKGIV